MKLQNPEQLSGTATKRRRIMILPPSHRLKQWGRLYENHSGVRGS
ncbi:MAG: hypothetical protein ACLS9V_14750 [Ruminococcus sp.]